MTKHTRIRHNDPELLQICLDVGPLQYKESRVEEFLDRLDEAMGKNPPEYRALEKQYLLGQLSQEELIEKVKALRTEETGDVT